MLEFHNVDSTLSVFVFMKSLGCAFDAPARSLPCFFFHRRATGRVVERAYKTEEELHGRHKLLHEEDGAERRTPFFRAMKT